MSTPDGESLPLAGSLQEVVGALIFSADHPLTPEEIRRCLRSVAEGSADAGETAKIFAEASPREIADAIDGIGRELKRLGLGIELAEVSGGFRFQTQPSSGRWVRNLLKADRPTNLSRPALETLAIIAYRQPITKSEIEAIRGVMVDYIVKSLMELHLIRIVGRSELPGRPFLYGTTTLFLNHFGLSNLKELNALDPTLQRSSPGARKALHKKARPEAKVERDEEAVNEILGKSVAGEGAQEALFADD